MISQTYQRYWMYVNIHLKDSNSPVKMKFTIFAVVFIYFLNHGVFHVQAEIEESLADLMLEQLYSLKSYHSRHVREVASGTSKHIAHIEFKVKSTCKENGHDAEKLEKTLEETKACISKKKIFVDTADDYINNMEHCSKDLIKQLEKCLPEKLKYLPPFIFHLFESLIRLLYHDTIIIETEIRACLPKLKSEESVAKYNDCCEQVTSRIETIPESKAEFCGNFIAMNNCFLKQLKEECKQDGEIKTFEKDLEEAVKKPCEMK